MSACNLISADHCDQWMNALESCGLYDTYHLPEYHQLAEIQGEGQPFLFFFQNAEDSAALPLLIRKISDVPGLEDCPLFDATSVYGYPGVVTNVENNSMHAEAFRHQFQAALLNVFHEKKIIAFFTRQNPLFSTSWLFQGMGEILAMGRTIAIDLEHSMHEQEKGMTKGHRYDIRKARESGVTSYDDNNFERLDDFISIYNETMQRNDALEYYFFPDSYYGELIKSLGQKIKLFVAEKDGELISASLFLLTDKIIQYHLSGSPAEYLKLSGAKVILDEVRHWGTNHGYKWLHLGGGLGSAEDSLFRFKAGFSKSRFSFEVIRAILEPQIYTKLVSQKNRWMELNGFAKKSDNYFPAYRAPFIKKS